MKKTKKLQNNESSENPEEFLDMYEFMEMPDVMYVPKKSKLIGESADRIKKEFCIDNMVYYNPLKVIENCVTYVLLILQFSICITAIKLAITNAVIHKKDNNVISHKNSVELMQGMKLKSGHLFVIGQWGGIKRFEETYNLNGKLR